MSSETRFIKYFFLDFTFAIINFYQSKKRLFKKNKFPDKQCTDKYATKEIAHQCVEVCNYDKLIKF